MPVTLNERIIAYLVLFSGLIISGVAEYYSIMGLIAIYPAAFWPIVIMGVALGLGKIAGTVWIKQNWDYAPFFLKTYILPAIVVLMVITSLGVFGFLSKAHSDQSLVSGDVQSKIAVYDEKIKTAKENIDANRKALKQMDDAVDQVMGRSQDEKGADKAVAIRRGQAKERTRLLSEITAEQKAIAQLSEERAPIAAEVRKVEAEVGPIKYIAHMLYGENPDANILEKAVIWVTVLIVTVLDPLAVILLLASQYSFQNFREREQSDKPDAWIADVGEKPTKEELTEEGDSPIGPIVDIVSPDTTVTHNGFVAQEVASVIPEAVVMESTDTTIVLEMPGTIGGAQVVFPEEETPMPVDQWNKMIEEAERAVAEEKANPKEYVVDAELIDALEGTVNRLQQENDELKAKLLSADVKLHGFSSDGDRVIVAGSSYPRQEFDRLMSSTYVQNEEQTESGKWKEINSKISEEEYIALAKKQNDNSNNAA